MKRRLTSLFTVCVILSLMLSGCGGSSNYASESAMMTENYDREYASDDVYMSKASADYAMEEAEEMPNNGSASENVEVADSSRKIIKTVNLSVETEEFDKLLGNIKNKVDSMGGYLENTDISGKSLYSTGGEKRYANITARVPSNKLDEFVNNIAENSNVTNKSENAQDVTLNYTDTKAHIDSLRIEQERLDELLKAATDIETIVAIEDKRTSVRYEIESYESQLRTFDNKIDYSTVYLYISEVVEYTTDPEEKLPFATKVSQGFSKSFSDVIETVVDNFADFIIDIPYIILSIISFVIGLAIFCVVLFVIIKAISIVSKKASSDKTKKTDAKKTTKKDEKKITKDNAKKEGNVNKPAEKRNIEANRNSDDKLDYSYKEIIDSFSSIGSDIAKDDTNDDDLKNDSNKKRHARRRYHYSKGKRE